MTGWRSICLVLGLLSSVAGVRAAEPDVAPCPLKQVAALAMVTEPDGKVSVPAAVNGFEGLFLVDTGGIQTLIGASLASKLGLRTELSDHNFRFLGGVVIRDQARVDSLQLGGVKTKDAILSVVPNTMLLHDTIGILSSDILGKYDVELDFAAGRFNLFEPSNCPGNLTYWTKGGFARVPMVQDPSGHILIAVKLDGKDIVAAVDTGAHRTMMSLAAYSAIFGRDQRDPAMTKLGDFPMNGAEPTTIYHYPFQEMLLEGVQVQKPDIDIIANRGIGGGAQMILGIETLRQLHLYVAYKEGALYVTGAEAR